MSSELQLDVRQLIRWKRNVANAYEVKTQAWRKVMAVYRQGWLKKSAAGWPECLYTGIRSGPNAR